MASFKNFSKSNRSQKDGVVTKYNDINKSERTKINENQVEEFAKNKEQWRELLSYFRLRK
jgi:hypothetical protein